MPDEHRRDAVDRAIYVDGVAMVRLLGPQDRLLHDDRARASRRRRARARQPDHPRRGRRAGRAAERSSTSSSRWRKDGLDLGPSDVTTSARILERGRAQPGRGAQPGDPHRRGKSIRPKTLGQKAYVDAIDENTIVFGIGPAGTGKTYLAMAKAVQALQRKEVERIILTRPAVEAGERLGFLPGTLNDKIDPYLRPLYDALNEMMDPELVPKLLASGHGRGRAARVHARSHAQQLVRRARRGAEHDARADEDVPHPARLRHEDGRHRRHHADRPARRARRACSS